MTFQSPSAQRLAHMLLSLIIGTALSLAQESRGTISGTVTDSSGAIVPHAAVTATNIDTNVGTKVTTNENGVYTLPFLLPGSYRVTASAPVS
jgi:hypothetical protein